MDLLTHTLASAVLARAGMNHARLGGRLAMPVVLLAGIAPDLDWLSRLAGPSAHLAWHRAATHSLLGAGALAVAIALVLWALGRRNATARESLQAAGPAWGVSLSGAVLAAAGGAALHILLDLANNRGVQLLWPLGERRYAWDIADVIDPWVIALLVLGLVLPGLFRLVTQEIGARPARHGARRGAMVALALLALYFGGRAWLHMRATALLNAHLYRGAVPLAVGVFPSAVSPLIWYAIVETENTLEEMEVRLGPGQVFLPDRGRTNFKPDPSPALEAAQMTRAAEDFLRYARFPHATVVRLREGYRIELRDLRFAAALPRRPGLMAVIEVDAEMKVESEELLFEPAPSLR